MKIPTAFIDLIFSVALVFLTSTVLLVRYANSNPEVILPPLELPTANSATRSSPGGDSKALSLSITRIDNHYSYYLDSSLVTLADLKARLGKSRPTKVTLRVGRKVIQEVTSKVFEILIQSGIKEVSFAGIGGGHNAK